MGRARETIVLDTNILVGYPTYDDAKQFKVARTLLESLTLYTLDWKLSRLEGVSLLDGHAS